VNDFDLFIIGAGSGGVRAARLASSLGIRTGIAEGWSLGGTCVNRGCIPKKLYSYASHFSEDFEVMNSFGWNVKNKEFNWKRLVNNKKKEITRLNSIYLNLLKDSKVKIFNDYAQFIDRNTIKIGKIKIRSKNILIAVGTKPRKLEIFNNCNLISSDEAFNLKKLPKSILILGGGYIAVEFASIFNGLGVKTTLCIRGERILKDFDQEVSEFLMNQMKHKGVKFISKDFPKKILHKKHHYEVFFKEKMRSYEKVMEAVGRVPNIKRLNLDKAKIKLSENGAIKIDEYFKTSVKNIYAIGDVVDRIQLTPVAIREAMNFVNNLKSSVKQKFNYKNIPTAVFSNPNYSFIGYTEYEARRSFKKINVYKSQFKSLKLSLSNLNEKVFIKLITNALNDKILGLHYIGENAAEIVQGFSVAVVNGLTKKQLDKTVGIHPTCAEEIVTLRNNKEY
tara:strand:- start:40 stop:1386 length:1347 start_codon:yes stop_codon:yes gene_type:complete